MPNTFGMSLKILSIFLWNMLPAGAAPNASHLYLYCQNWHANIVRYEDFSSSFKLWYPELASISERYFALLSPWRILFRVGPLCIGLMRAWFWQAGSRHNPTLPLALGANTKLLHHSDVSWTPSGSIMSSFCSLSNSSWNGFLKWVCHASQWCLVRFAIWF